MITIKDFYQNNNNKTSYKYYEATKKTSTSRQLSSKNILLHQM